MNQNPNYIRDILKRVSDLEAELKKLVRSRAPARRVAYQPTQLHQNPRIAKFIKEQLEIKTLEKSVEDIHNTLCSIRAQLHTASQKSTHNAAGTAWSTMAPDSELLASEAFQKEKEESNQDEHDFKAHCNEAKNWRDRTEKLRSGIKAAIPTFDSALADCKQAKAALPEELQVQLKERQKALELLRKMLARLPERAAGLANEENLEPLPAPVSQQEWADLLGRDADEVTARRIMARHLKSRSHERYQVVSRSRELASRYRKELLTFIEKQLLPVLDGIDDGRKFSLPLMEQFKAKSPDLDLWFKVYGVLSRRLLDVLEQADVQPIDVKLGTPIDFECHEPFEMEPEPNMDNESIKSVNRKGYQYIGEDGRAFLLRPVQVIVVQNSPR